MKIINRGIVVLLAIGMTHALQGMQSKNAVFPAVIQSKKVGKKPLPPTPLYPVKITYKDSKNWRLKELLVKNAFDAMQKKSDIENLIDSEALATWLPESKENGRKWERLLQDANISKVPEHPEQKKQSSGKQLLRLNSGFHISKIWIEAELPSFGRYVPYIDFADTPLTLDDVKTIREIESKDKSGKLPAFKEWLSDPTNAGHWAHLLALAALVNKNSSGALGVEITVEPVKKIVVPVGEQGVYLSCWNTTLRGKVSFDVSQFKLSESDKAIVNEFVCAQAHEKSAAFKNWLREKNNSVDWEYLKHLAKKK